MAFRSNNPSVRAKTFEFGDADIISGTMTMSGAVNKSGILLAILLVSAALGWTLGNPILMIGGAILGLITCLMLVFNRTMAPVLAPTYAVFEGLFIGTLSATYEARFPGVAANAMTLTFATLAMMLGLYHFGILSATERFRRVIMISTAAICITYVVDLLLTFAGMPIAMIHEASPLGIAFSVGVTALAAFNLILDFDLFERYSHARVPKYMEWYVGFSLLVTLVWLYMEILRLLTKLNRR